MYKFSAHVTHGIHTSKGLSKQMYGNVSCQEEASKLWQPYLPNFRSLTRCLLEDFFLLSWSEDLFKTGWCEGGSIQPHFQALPTLKLGGGLGTRLEYIQQSGECLEHIILEGFGETFPPRCLSQSRNFSSSVLSNSLVNKLTFLQVFFFFLV